MSADEPTDPLAAAIAGLHLRGIGPAFMGGRIADIAVHPSRRSTWYVAVGSGGVWKTTNAGTTWAPVFERQSSYSVGCVTIDPARPDVVWVGTGEGVSGRHVGWGDGVHRTRDGGRTWERVGLEGTEHIKRILVDPRDSDVVYVAAEGPLWSSGGRRGVLKSTDAGATWDTVLEIDDDTGVTDLVFAPDDPDTLHAASYQRRRRVWSFLGGGPGSGIHTTTDGGATWRRRTEGLPDGDMGKIGLAVTPADPAVVYATIEAAEDQRGFYRSVDRGESWEKRSEYVSGGTGPHYYQEIVASPHDVDTVYQVDVFVHVTRDGGEHFTHLETGRTKHSDNHAIWIDPDDATHLLVGTDAGLYETHDDGATFRHFPNLPVSQFYRVAVDESSPFTNVLAGAQDLGTLYGPTRTAHVDGVRNQDWSVPLGADGYHVAFDPTDPDTCYLEWQVGNVMRLDRRTMELTDVQPQPAPGDPPERWNWDTPIVVSAHDNARIYVASQRVWRSDDRGETWAPLSGDLTRGRNRYELATGERVVGVDSLFDHGAMSLYGTITCLGESPIDEALLVVGTDDGLVQVSEDGGSTWRTAAPLPDLAPDGFVNAVRPSHHDADVVFVAADAHKNGDFTPCVHVSDDRGRTWRSIRGDLPEGTIVWCIEQDHVVADLLFVGAEFGLHVSLDGGEHWHRLSGEVPTIAFRDLAVQRRDDDLIAASFGRGIYVLDDYSPLRDLATGLDLDRPGSLLSARDAWWYVPYEPMQAAGQPTLGSSAWRAPNPPFGAVFTFHLAADVERPAAQRRAADRKAVEAGDDAPFPGWDALWEEHLGGDPAVRLVVRDGDGAVVRAVDAPTKAGLHRVAWDLRRPATKPVSTEKPSFEPPWETPPRGPLAPPGEYTVELIRVDDDGVHVLDGPRSFAVRPVPAVLDRGFAADDDFRLRTAALSRRVEGAAATIERLRDRLRHLRATLPLTPDGEATFGRDVADVHRRLELLHREIVADPVRERLAEAAVPTVRSSVTRVTDHHWDTTAHPTPTQLASVERAEAAFASREDELTAVAADLDVITADLDAAGAPWTRR